MPPPSRSSVPLATKSQMALRLVEETPLAGCGVEIGEVDPEPDIVVVERVRGRSGTDIGGIGERSSPVVGILPQPGQDHRVKQRPETLPALRFDEGRNGRQRSRKRPEVGKFIGCGFAGEVGRLIGAVVGIVLPEEPGPGDGIIGIERIEHRRGACGICALLRSSGT